MLVLRVAVILALCNLALTERWDDSSPRQRTQLMSQYRSQQAAEPTGAIRDRENHLPQPQETEGKDNKCRPGQLKLIYSRTCC